MALYHDMGMSAEAEGEGEDLGVTWIYLEQDISAGSQSDALRAARRRAKDGSGRNNGETIEDAP